MMVRQWRKKESGLPSTAKGRPVVDGPSVVGPLKHQESTNPFMSCAERRRNHMLGEYSPKQPVSDSPVLCTRCKSPLHEVENVGDRICTECFIEIEDKEGICPDCGEANFPNMPNELCDECSLMDARGIRS